MAMRPVRKHEGQMTTKKPLVRSRRWDSFVLWCLSALVMPFVVSLGLITHAWQDTRARYRAEASLVRVDIYPTIDGVPVQDLTADDLEIREDGALQKVETFEHVTVPRAAVPDSRPEPSTVDASRTIAGGERTRIIVVFLDTYHTDQGAARAIYAPLVRLLDRSLGPDDVIGVMTPEMSARDVTFSRRASSVEPVLARWAEWGRRDQTRDRDEEEEQYERCFREGGHLQTCADPSDPQGARIASYNPYSGIARDMVSRRREHQVMTSLTDLTRVLAGLNDGRKAVIAISSGWLLWRPDPSLARLSRCDSAPGPGRVGTTSTGRLTTDDDGERTGMSRTQCEIDRQRLSHLDVRYDFQRMMAEANRANVSFYPIDARGLTAIDAVAGPALTDTVSEDTRRAGSRVGALRMLADNTDGLAVVNTNDFDRGLTSMLTDLSSYYLVSYYSSNTKADGGFRKIDVRVKRRGVDVRARKGYRALSAREIEQERMAAARAGQTVGGAASPVLAAIASLGQQRPGTPLRTRIAYTPAQNGRVHLWTVAELDASVARQGGWLGGGEVDVRVTGAGNETLGSGRAALGGGQRALVVDVGELPVRDGQLSIDTTARPIVEGAPVTDTLTIFAPGAAGDVGVPVVRRRGPSTGMAYVATADPRFTRMERVRLEMPVRSAPSEVRAALLDRVGKPIAVPVTTAQRVEGDMTWITAELSLAPLAAGDYVLRLSLDGAAGTSDIVSALRIVP